MLRPIFSMFALMMLVVSAGCSPEAVKQVGDKASGAVSDAAGSVADAAKDAAGDMMGKASEALAGVEGGSDMLKKVTDMFAQTTNTLGGITDVDTAKAALPDLGKLTESFGGMSEGFGKLPDAAKGALAGVFKSSIDQLKPIIDKLMAIPGVEAVLKPAVEALMGKLDAFKA